MDRLIPLYKLESSYISKTYNNGKWIDGVYSKRLEEALKEYLRVKYVILTNSGTSSLFAAYWALKDVFSQLYIDPYTFPASYTPARLLNFKVIYQRLWLMKKMNKVNKKSLYTLIHLFGQPNPFSDNLNAQNYIEDACQAFGAEYKNKKVGTIGRIGCFSFYPTKSLHTCGHGGAVTTNNEEDYLKMKVFIESGRLNGILTNSIGLNLRMDEIKAEYLLYELKNFDKKIEIQRSIAKEYISIVGQNQPFLEEKNNSKHTYSIFNLLIKKRDQFRKFMEECGIQTMVYYSDDILSKEQKSLYKDITSSIVAIPCRSNLTSSEIKRIKKALQEWFL